MSNNNNINVQSPKNLINNNNGITAGFSNLINNNININNNNISSQ